MSKKTKVVLGVAASAAFLVLLGWIAATLQVSMPHPRADGVRLVKPPGSRGFKVMRAQSPAPRAEADEESFDFGVMDPLTLGSHTFIVKNVGEAPLTLEKGPTTCRCTLSETSSQPIPPGGQGEVKLEWNSGNKKLAFLQTAEIITNDPKNKRLRFQVTGLVRMGVGADRQEIVFTDLAPDKAGRGEALIFSQLHDSFTIEGGESSLPGLTWRVEPANAAELDALQALSGYKMLVELPADMATGHFAETLRLSVNAPTASAPLASDAPASDPPASDPPASDTPATDALPPDAPVPGELAADPNTIELTIAGNVLRRLAIYGDGIDGEGIVDLGLIRKGKSKSVRFLVKVRDPEPQVEFEPVIVEPSLVEARIGPHPGGAERGLYQLEIEIPADAPTCYHVAPHYGRLKLRPKHPRVEEVELKLNFAVTEAGGEVAIAR